MPTSMAVEVVVPRSYRSRHVDLQQALTYRVGFFDEAEIHPADAIFGLRKRRHERWVGQQALPRPLGPVGSVNTARHFTCEQKRKRSRLVTGAWSDVFLKTLPDASGASNVDRLGALRQPVDATPRHRSNRGQRADRHRHHRRQAFQRRMQFIDHGSEVGMKHEARVSGGTR